MSWRIDNTVKNVRSIQGHDQDPQVVLTIYPLEKADADRDGERSYRDAMLEQVRSANHQGKDIQPRSVDAALQFLEMTGYQHHH